MILVEKLLQEFEDLPEDRQLQVIDFIEFLKAKEQKKVEDMMDAIIADNKEAFIELAK